MSYIIYESAITSSIENFKHVDNNPNIVEFITVLQEADVKNRNGRIYPKQVIDAGLRNPIIEEKIRTNTWFGEAGHPYSKEMERQTNVDLRNIAFRIVEYWWEENLLKARCRTLDTALGRDMAGLIKDGCKLSFSMRGQGNVVRDPIRDALVVQSPLMIICYDWVFLPSHNVAYMTNVCEDTKASLARFSNKNNMQVSLNESCNLYESGLLINTENTNAEKELIDYLQYSHKKFKTLEETYIYDPEDILVESNKSFVILENSNVKKKVSTNDYILEKTRHDILEDIGSIAPIARTVSEVIVPVKEAATEPSSPTITLANEIGVGSDGIATDPNEKSEIKNSLDYNPNDDDTADVERKDREEEKTISEDVEIPEGIEDKKPEESTPEVETDDVREKLDCAEDVDHVENVDASETKQPENKDYVTEELEMIVDNILKYDNTLSHEEICRRALEYKEYMSEECANLFENFLDKE